MYEAGLSELGDAALASLHELFRPRVAQALRYAFLAAQRSNTVITAQAFQHDAYLVFRREMPVRGTADVLHDLASRFLDPGCFGVMLGSFVTTMKPILSLILCNQSFY